MMVKQSAELLLPNLVLVADAFCAKLIQSHVSGYMNAMHPLSVWQKLACQLSTSNILQK